MKNQISHADAVFAILKAGLILLADNSSTVLPELQKWDIIKYLEIKNSLQVFLSKNLEKKKKNIQEKYHMLLRTQIQMKVVTFFKHLVSSLMGYSEETYFDVNCLVVDEENVIFSSYNKEIFKQLEKKEVLIL